MVFMHSRGGAPVPGVQVTAVGAAPTHTGDDGLFQLRFPEREPGQDVELSVAKEGLVVVNDLHLLQRLPKDPAARPAVLLLSAPEEREAWALRFYRLEIDRIVQERYEKRLAELNRQGQAGRREMARLQQELEQARSQVEKYAEALATHRPDDDFGDYAKGRQLFLAGDIEGALEIFSLQRLERDAAKAMNDLRAAAQGFADRARILALQFDFDGADAAFKRRAELLPDDFPAQLDYAVFLYKQKRYAPAEERYQKALALATAAGDEARRAGTLNNLGILHADENRRANALQAYEEALEIYGRLVKDIPAYTPELELVEDNMQRLMRDTAE